MHALPGDPRGKVFVEKAVVDRERAEAEHAVELGTPMSHSSKPRRQIILELVTADPHISLRELREATHLASESNAHYHVKHLEAAGLVHYEGLRRYSRTASERRKEIRRQTGNVPMRKMSRAEELRRIEMVVAKALTSTQVVPGEDAVQISAGPLFKNDRLRAIKIG